MSPFQFRTCVCEMLRCVPRHQIIVADAFNHFGTASRAFELNSMEKVKLGIPQLVIGL